MSYGLPPPYLWPRPYLWPWPPMPHLQTEMHQPSIQPPLPQLGEILSTLNYIATKVRTDGGFSNNMASQLKKHGYDVPTAPREAVMKVLLWQ